MKRIIKCKSFRLIDFHPFDDVLSRFTDTADTTKSSDSDDNVDDSRAKVPKTRQFLIQMFGVNESGQTCSIMLHDFQPFFFVRLSRQWCHQEIRAWMTELKQQMPKYMADALIDITPLQAKSLYGFRAGSQEPFLQLKFASQQAFHSYKNLWYEDHQGERRLRAKSFQKTLIDIFEGNIPPLLRYFHMYGIQPSGWVSVPTHAMQEGDHPTTTCTFEYICTCNQVKAMPTKETRVPYKICSFDIEASSSHGDFPVPIKNYKRLATQIVDVMAEQPHVDVQFMEKCVLTAFGYAHVEGIDRVYPQNQPTLHQLRTQLPRLETCGGGGTFLPKCDSKKTVMMPLDSTTWDEEMDVGDGGGGGGMEDDDGGVADGDDDMAHIFHRPIQLVIPPSALLFALLISKTTTREFKIDALTQRFAEAEFPKLCGDETTFIGSTFLRHGEEVPYLNHCMVVGSCDSVEGAVIETFATERDMIIAWTLLIQHENPDIIIGYNIFGFDFEFLFRRAQETHCENDFLKLSKCRDQVCGKQRRDGGTTTMDIDTTKIVLATGEYDLRYIATPGRLHLDMYMYFRRDFNLPSYKLDDVSSRYISDDIISWEEFWGVGGEHGLRLYSKNLLGLKAGDYIHIEWSGITSDYYDGKIPVWNVVANSCIEIPHQPGLEQRVGKTLKWSMAKDDITPQDIFRLTREGGNSGRALVAKYCIQDCNLVHHLMRKVDVWTGYMEMSRICSVPISFLVFRGQGIKLTSYVAKICRERNTLMPDLPRVSADGGYEGAIVLPPKCDMYGDQPVACVDYSSLYPSILISQNCSPDTLVWTREVDLEGRMVNETGIRNGQTGAYVYDNLPGYEYVEITFDTFRWVRKSPTSKAIKVQSGTKTCRWVQYPEGQYGIIPMILKDLLHARADTRKMAKMEKDPFMANILDKRQNGYKITANSLYGQCGSRTSTFYHKDVAACCTATGRQMITYAKRMIEEIYDNVEVDTQVAGRVHAKAEYVYGDTDSVFFTFHLKEQGTTGTPILGKRALEITIELAKEAADLCSQHLKPPMKLAYEKTLMNFILLSKKRYAGWLYEEDPDYCELKYMGLSLKRRDYCDLTKDIYSAVLHELMTGTNVQAARNVLETWLHRLVSGQVPMDKLCLTRSLRSGYKNPNQIAHAVLAKRMGERDPGNRPKPGDRIQYLFVVGRGGGAATAKPLLGERIETPEYIRSHNLTIDYHYYIEAQVMKPLMQLLGLCVELIWEKDGKRAPLKQFRTDLARIRKDVGDDMEAYNKAKEKLASVRIREMLFDPVLQDIHRKKQGLQSVKSFFAPRP